MYDCCPKTTCFNYNLLKLTHTTKMVKHNILKGFYDVERTIGCGGFAKVKLATHLATGEKVAIKIMEKGLLKDDLPRVRIELKALKSLSHEHICKLYQVLETETHFFIVMEYCSGGELFDHIVEKNRLTETESRTFFRQIISAVAYLHSNGYAHRDLKPENVLLDSSHQLKLIDFGLCAHPDGGVQNGALFTSCGSPTYAAPELVLGKQYMGAQVDVWAMGVLLYALMAGRLPFDDQNIDKLYRKILSGKYEEPHCMSLPSRRLIRAMLQVDPLQRITVEQLLQHPWMTAGSMPAIRLPRTPLNKQQQSFMVDNAEDSDIIDLMAFYHGASTVDMRCHLMRGKYDYDTATYLLLVAKRRRGLPIGLISGAATRLPIRIKSSDSIKPSVTLNKIRPTTRSASKITRQHLDSLLLPPPPPPSFSFDLKSPLPVTPTRAYKRNDNYKLQQELEQSDHKMGTPTNQRINMEDKSTSTRAKTNIIKPPLVEVQCNTSYSWVQQSDLVDQLLSPAPALPRLLRPRTPAVVYSNWTSNTLPISVRTPNGPVGIRKPIKRIRSPNLDGECSPVPNKKSAPATPVMQTSEMNKIAHNGIENGGSARKVFESIERSLHRVKNVLTPRKNAEAPSQPAILNNKNLCNVSTTQCTDAEFVIEELSKALRKTGIHCIRKGFTIRGKMDPPLLMSSPVAGTSAGSGCSFELEICYLPQMGLLPSTSISNASAAINNGNSSHTPKRRSGGGGFGAGGSGGLVARLRSSHGGNNNVTHSPVRTRNARRSVGDGPAQHQVVPPAMVGIRRKRLKGDSWCYKKVCEQVLALTATDLKQIKKESVV